MWHWLKTWWNPGFDCNSVAIAAFLRVNGHHQAAAEIDALFRR